MAVRLDYSTVDDAIIQAIDDGKDPYTDRRVSITVYDLGFNVTGWDVVTVVERRLQSLRKRGVIHYDRGFSRWFIVPGMRK